MGIRDDKAPIWEWFIQTIYGDLRDGLSLLYSHYWHIINWLCASLMKSTIVESIPGNWFRDSNHASRRGSQGVSSLNAWLYGTGPRPQAKHIHPRMHIGNMFETCLKHWNWNHKFNLKNLRTWNLKRWHWHKLSNVGHPRKGVRTNTGCFVFLSPVGAAERSYWYMLIHIYIYT